MLETGYLTQDSLQMGHQRAQDRLFPNARSGVSEVLRSEISLLPNPQLSLRGPLHRVVLFLQPRNRRNFRSVALSTVTTENKRELRGKEAEGRLTEELP